MTTDKQQSATITADYQCKFTTSHRKEGKCFLEVLQIITMDTDSKRPDRRAHVPVELRLYGTGKMNYACLWINHNGTHAHASGSAGGYGYHRPSAAAQEAISNAGIRLACPIDGVGSNAIEEALCAIADALGVKDYALTRAHA